MFNKKEGPDLKATEKTALCAANKALNEMPNKGDNMLSTNSKNQAPEAMMFSQVPSASSSTPTFSGIRIGGASLTCSPAEEATRAQLMQDISELAGSIFAPLTRIDSEAEKIEKSLDNLDENEISLLNDAKLEITTLKAFKLIFEDQQRLGKSSLKPSGNEIIKSLESIKDYLSKSKQEEIKNLFHKIQVLSGKYSTLKFNP